MAETVGGGRYAPGMIIAHTHTARGIAARDLNESFIGDDLAIEIGGLAHFVRVAGIQQTAAGNVRLFVGVPIGDDGEPWLDLAGSHTVYQDAARD